MRREFSSQAAMEYLTTYAWAFLIISLGIASLYATGILNAYLFTPRLSTGSCLVQRPNGAASTLPIGFQGVCTGIPQFVSGFNGQSNVGSNVTIQYSKLFNANSITLVVWIKPNRLPFNWQWTGIVVHSDDTGYGGYQVTAVQNSNNVRVQVGNMASQQVAVDMPVIAGQWSQIAFTFNGAYVAGYYNGTLKGTSAALGGNMGYYPAGSAYSNIIVGSRPGKYFFNGSIANLQIYNTSLSGNEIEVLFLKGIGGAPTKLNNLVGWWPLNGDALDYSGDGTNGAPSNIIFTSSWTNGYGTP